MRRYLLPLSWWKLSALWLLNLKTRTPRARRALVGHSIKIALMGLSGGLAALSLTLAIVSGFEWKLASFVAENGGDLLHQNSWMSFDDLKKRVELAPEGVQELEVFWTAPALIVGKEGGRGIRLESARRYQTTQDFLNDNFDTHEGIVPQVELGKALAESLNVSTGDKLRILLPGVLRGSLEVEVTGLKELGVYELESRWVRVSDQQIRFALEQRDPQAFSQRQGDAHGIRYFLGKDFHRPGRTQPLETWRSLYRNNLEANFDAPPFLRTWAEQRRNLFGSIGLDKMVLSVILGLLCLVAALNVGAALLVLFLERDREIAVLQAVGLGKKQLMGWILIQGTLMGLVASIGGICLGYLFGWILQSLPIAQIPSEIYNLSVLPLKFVWEEQLLVFVYGVLAAWLLSFVMGWTLLKTHFLETLRHRS